MPAACPEMHQTQLHSWMLKGLRNIMATFGIAAMGAGCVVMMILEKFAVFSQSVHITDNARVLRGK